MSTPAQNHTRVEVGGISRRRLLQLSAAAGASAFLAGSLPSAAGRVLAQDGEPSTPTGPLYWASWVGYMPTDEAGVGYPVLDAFTAETGIEVVYDEAVDENEGFFASDLQGPLSAGLSTGWDLVTLTDWMMQRLIGLGWLERIDIESMANYPANLEDIYRDRPWDPENAYAVPWQSGMTGLGFDRAVTGDLDSLQSFWDPAWKERMSYQTELNDTVGLSALRLGLEPGTLTQEQYDAALAEVRRAVDEGLPRALLGNSYYAEMLAGNVVLGMTWSGDMVSLIQPEQSPDQDFRFMLPTEGGMIWTDFLGIPLGAAGKAAAEAWIDHYYRPAVAAEIAAWVNYLCPVKGARDELARMDPELANNPLIFPTDEMRARLHAFISVDEATRSQWESDFADAIGL